MEQPFDGTGRLLCLGCRQPIMHGHLWLEVRQYDDENHDTRLAIHPACLDRLPGVWSGEDP